MKPKLYKITFGADSSFLYKKFECDHFNDPWHFHKEYELVMINKSSGLRFIGDNVSPFQEGNLALIGSNIPHFLRNGEEFYSGKKKFGAISTYIHFTKNFLGNNFFDIPEMKLVLRLLERSALGLDIFGKTKEYVIKKLEDMHNQNPEQRLLSLLEILIKLSESNELKPILSTGYSANNSGDTERINQVFEYIIENYTEEIYLQKIASQLNMSVASFSRYFKQYTGKTFSDYVTEIRIGCACRLLMENVNNISEISYKSGFDNLSNFYRHFKKTMGIIPKEYRSRFLNVIE